MEVIGKIMQVLNMERCTEKHLLKYKHLFEKYQNLQTNILIQTTSANFGNGNRAE